MTITDKIHDASLAEIGPIVVAAVRRLGELGLQGREAVEAAMDEDDSVDLAEGLGQLSELDRMKEYL